MSEPKISMADLEHIAKLARINLSESEKTTFLPQLESVLEYLDVLNQANVDNIEPTYRVNDQKNVLRNDEVVESFDQKTALSTAPKTQDGYFVVPGTIRK
ncbi:MAG: Asp-tRNA(Asn)/Glu-tRNA(Gln) amidotransferase subunit GatC [Candidatus Shapirobacteria bacterium]|nr:Asp-tRNA(Asn)/Glu-tRNA(Gln) amidotransferase subunit GatC [Candidatus Shapirobacteria bacterium]MDD4410776.1 Asp-tRNA(Asn)/Glu-tRNA(Gln) amidotransferase subunit GatC [Candidatus Shapirobacteria bacterium]